MTTFYLPTPRQDIPQNDRMTNPRLPDFTLPFSHQSSVVNHQPWTISISLSVPVWLLSKLAHIPYLPLTSIQN
jgi:hypothetical protein